MVTAKTARLLTPLLLFLSIIIPSISNATPPAIPQDFRYAIYSDSTAELFWERTTNVSMQGYEISRNGESLGVYDALSYLDTTLSPGTQYTFSISAVGSNGERSGMSDVMLVTPQYNDTIASLQREIASLEQEIVTLESQLNGGFRSPVPQTGQTVSNRFGDDGDHQAGVPWPVPRFIINVNAEDDTNENAVCDDNETCNGSVTDNLTGLVWLQNANCFGDDDWPNAIDDSNALTGDGTSNCALNDNSQTGDWRLPNLKEMQSLLDYGHSFPTALLPADHPFSNVQLGGITTAPDRYWTSTSTGPDDSDGVYSVSVSVGWVERLSTVGTSFTGYVWPVRDR